MVIEVFKTNIDDERQANTVAAHLSGLFQFASVSFDLEDCDRILRVEGTLISATQVISAVAAMGFICEILE